MTLLLSALGVWSAAGQGFDLSTVLPCGTSSPAFPEMGYVWGMYFQRWGMYFQRWGMYFRCAYSIIIKFAGKTMYLPYIANISSKKKYWRMASSL